MQRTDLAEKSKRGVCFGFGKAFWPAVLVNQLYQTLHHPGYFKISFLKDVQIVRDDPGWRFGKAPRCFAKPYRTSE
ncbi:hypothetical protein JW964_21895 [candidate division KSB1 bacterium]|nr:hypothetical protein [candidate division KSB1 bacterium]